RRAAAHPNRVTPVAVQHLAAADVGPVLLPGAHHPVPAPQQPRKPLLPPIQPAGSSDSSAHGPTSLAGGPGGTHVPFTHFPGSGLNLARSPSTPRLAVAPGQQPGTSPDGRRHAATGHSSPPTTGVQYRRVRPRDAARGIVPQPRLG